MSFRQTTVEFDETGAAAQAARFAIWWLYPSPQETVSLLGDKRLLLGRDDDCDLQLTGTGASRHHAEIVRDGPIWVVRDLKSTNGVFVDGMRVDKAALANGKLLRLGQWLGVVAASPSGDGPHFAAIARGLLVGPMTRAVVQPLQRAAGSDLPVIVLGETGTGKECVARAVHEWSGRTGDFIAVNCAALPEALAEGELFGYRKGAFTGAERASPGHFRAADGGTLLLDEITDLPLTLQAKLLRVLEEGEVVPLGESRPVPLNVRVIAAGQEPLHIAVDEKRFRADLYARLDGLAVVLPPLRERRLEIPHLVHAMLREHSGGRAPRIDVKLVEALCLYDLPFNVRELRLAIKRMLVLHGHEDTLKRSHLPERILRSLGDKLEQGASSAAASRGGGDDDLVAALMAALREHGGVVARAAADVGMSRQRAYRLMEAQGVDLEALRKEQDP